jgi:hypothetical protein
MRTIAAEAPLRGTLLLAFDTLQDVYQALAAGIIDDEQASAADAALRVPCQLSLPQPLGSVLPKAPPPKPLAPPRRAPRSLDKARSIHRRRLLACSGPLPPALATNFTTSELAVLRIIGDECAAHGSSRLCVDAIAARAGCSRTVVQGTKRLARRLGLISVQERRLSYRRSDTTLIRVISKEWEAWLKHHCANTMRRAVATGLGCRNSQPMDTEVQEALPKKTIAPQFAAYDPLHRALERFGGAIKGMPSLSG